MKKYVWNIFLAIDQLGNAMAGGNPDETISSRLGRWAYRHDNAFARAICSVLDLLDPGHCSGSIEQDRDQARAFDDRPVAGLVLFLIACIWIYAIYGNLN